MKSHETEWKRPENVFFVHSLFKTTTSDKILLRSVINANCYFVLIDKLVLGIALNSRV